MSGAFKKASDIAREDSQLKFNALWEAGLSDVVQFFKALWPWDGYDRSFWAEPGAPAHDLTPLQLLEKLYVPERRTDVDVAALTEERFFRDPRSVTAEPQENILQFLKYPHSNVGPMLLLISSIGFGKTTLLHWFTKIWLEKRDPQLHKRLVPVFLDGAKFMGGDPKDVVPEIICHINSSLDQLEQSFVDFEFRKEALWGQEFQYAESELRQVQLTKGDDARKAREVEVQIQWESHAPKVLDRKLAFLAGCQKKLIVLVLDNLDQLPETNVAECIGAVHQIVARNPAIKVICSIRLYTVACIRHHPAFNAYDLESLYVGPPNLSRIIDKRLTLAQSHLDLRKIQEHMKARVRLQHIEDLIQTLFGYLQSTEVINLVEQTSSYNVRMSLMKILTILNSPYLEVDRILQKALLPHAVEKISISESLAFRSLILGRTTIFRNESSHLLNIYDNGNAERPLNNIVRMHLLFSIPNRDDRSYETIEVMEKMEILGHAPKQIHSALRTFILTGLLQQFEVSARRFLNDRESIGEIKTLFPTPALYYYRDVLLHKFDYLQYVALDTYLPEKYNVTPPGRRDIFPERLWRATALIHHVAVLERAVPFEKQDNSKWAPIEPKAQGIAAKVSQEAKDVLTSSSLAIFWNDHSCRRSLSLLDEIVLGTVEEPAG